MIEADAIVCEVPGRRLLDGVTVRVMPGRVLAVIGPNGAGKSTLLKCLAGELTPVSGEVRHAGRLVAEIPPLELARMRAVLPQMSRIPFEFTAREIVLLGRMPHKGAGRLGDAEIARQAMAAADAAHLADRFVNTLSGGELQRVHLARVLAQIWDAGDGRERSLLLDEPTSALDLRHQHLVLGRARRMAAQHVAVLVVLHDLDLAAQYADEILLLSNGAVRARGAPRDVISRDLLADVFGVDARVEHAGDGGPLHVMVKGVL